MNRQATLTMTETGNLQIHIPMRIRRMQGRKMILAPQALDGDVPESPAEPRPAVSGRAFPPDVSVALRCPAAECRWPGCESRTSRPALPTPRTPTSGLAKAASARKATSFLILCGRSISGNRSSSQPSALWTLPGLKPASILSFEVSRRLLLRFQKGNPGLIVMGDDLHLHKDKELEEDVDKRIIPLTEKLSAMGKIPIITSEELAVPFERRMREFSQSRATRNTNGR